MTGMASVTERRKVYRVIVRCDDYERSFDFEDEVHALSCIYRATVAGFPVESQEILTRAPKPDLYDQDAP